jgi:purine-binding chemotaxis protein CheW
VIDRSRGTQVEREIVVFRLAESVYGIDIDVVREIIRMQGITPVPNAPDFIEGVTNLRGKICPVMDMRRRFGLPLARITADSRIVVIEIDGEDVGMIVDAVEEVLRLPGSSVEPPPLREVKSINTDIIEGIANLGTRLIVLFDVDRILSDGPEGELEEIAA